MLGRLCMSTATDSIPCRAASLLTAATAIDEVMGPIQNALYVIVDKVELCSKSVEQAIGPGFRIGRANELLRVSSSG